MVVMSFIWIAKIILVVKMVKIKRKQNLPELLTLCIIN